MYAYVCGESVVLIGLFKASVKTTRVRACRVSTEGPAQPSQTTSSAASVPRDIMVSNLHINVFVACQNHHKSMLQVKLSGCKVSVEYVLNRK